MAVAWYDQWLSGSKKGTRLPAAERVWRSKEEGSRRRRFTQARTDERLAALRARFSVGHDGYLRDHDQELGRGSYDCAGGSSIGSVPCMLWKYCNTRLRQEICDGGSDLKAPDPVESTFLLDQVLVQDATWEITHASATDGSRKMVEGIWEVGRASVMHNGSKVFLMGGAMSVHGSAARRKPHSRHPEPLELAGKRRCVTVCGRGGVRLS